MKDKTLLLEAIATITGCVIGAGVLGIPYVVAKAGFFTGLVDIILIGILILILNFYLGEVVLRTKGKHQLTGYANKYLGEKGKYLMFFALLIGDLGALIAYLIGEGKSLSTLLGGDPLLWSFIFFAVGSFLVYKGIKSIAESEFLVSGLILVIVIVIGIFSFNHISILNYTGFNIKNIFIPYGTVLFAYLGFLAIPEAHEILINKRKLFKKAIMIGLAIPAVVYILFPLIIIGVTGVNTTEIATIGLSSHIGKIGFVLGNLFAVFAMFTSFLAISLALREVLNYDFKIKKDLSFLFATFLPLLIFLIVRKFASFNTVLNYAGALSGGFTGLMILLMAKKAEKLGDRKPEYKITKNVFVMGAIAIALILGIIFAFI
ncbi:MAG: aromatic amino acid transport family protein [Candidatus Nanoarchaeia archaeon]|nr:aromatic amino acid transport family protein [Candidatus Nanoarchaeia archaeon]MDD5587537.1 aromatic amino acid transport family protein [Candidatus Nanoarchaeia archaeon]